MKMLSFALFEFRYLVGSIQTLATFTLFFGITFLPMMVGEAVFSDGIGNVHPNSPYQIMMTLIVLSIFAIFISPAFVASSVLKDEDCRFNGILFSIPISKHAYLLGRFLGSFMAMMLAFLGAPFGMLLGALLATLGLSSSDPALYGPIDITHYLNVMLFFILPSMLTFGSLIFAITVFSKKIIYAYLTAFSLWVVYSVGSEIDFISPLFDPFMFQIFEQQTEYWTAIERNTQLLNFEGTLLFNRLMWLTISGLIFVSAFRFFSFQKVVVLPKKQESSQSKNVKDDELLEKSINTHKLQTSSDLNEPTYWSLKTTLKQFVFRTKFEVMSVFTSWPFMILMTLCCVLLFFKLASNDITYGLSAYPLTRLMIKDMDELLTMALLGILVFYAADIIWRERHDRFNEIIDATPTANWIFVFSKIIALCFVMASILLMGILIAITIQLVSGYQTLELGLYLQRGFFYLLTPFIFMAVLSCFFQVLAKNRFIGMALLGLYLIYVAATFRFGLEHPLFRFALSGIPAPLTDMNGSGRFIIAGYWMQLYWGAIAGLLVILTYLLWKRGTIQPLRLRLRALASFRSNKVAIPAFATLLLLIGSASYIFYNTNVLNKYRTVEAIHQIKLAYEQQYRQFEKLPMPRIIDVKASVDIYPYKRRVETRSTQILQNKTKQAINTVHVIFPIDSQLPSVELEGASLKSVNADLAYYIFDLITPMKPGDKRQLKFEAIIQQQGFSHARNNVKLVRNGTFLGNNHMMPEIGFSNGLMIRNNSIREEYGLPALARLPTLDDISARNNNYVRQDSDFINFETTVSTVKSQTAVSQGKLIKQWVDGDRNYFTYKTESPTMNMYTYLSAEYEVKRDKWNDVDIEVLYHSPHNKNISRMIDAVKDSLGYYSEAFSPYQYTQLRILEFPAYRNFARAYPGTIPFSEGIGFVADVTDPADIDLPYYVTAHEVAHQWWAHQVMAANVQGGTMLVETMAAYSALLVMEKKYGKHQIRKFLKYELETYLKGRTRDSEGEMPLFKVENQPHIHYRKGALIMYGLKDYVGEVAINRVLQKLIKNHAFKSAPYAVSTDFIDYLKHEIGPKYDSLIDDFFKKITLFDLRATKSSVTKMPDGQFKVSIDVEVSKLYQDAIGNQTEVAMDLPVDIGLFLKSPDDKDFFQGDVIKMKKQLITQSQATLEFIVEQRPNYVGIDPYHKLIDRNTEDNLFEVN
jgi:ABC-type transport system involved in multi-copper enzyme maturation permease subunit